MKRVEDDTIKIINNAQLPKRRHGPKPIKTTLEKKEQYLKWAKNNRDKINKRQMKWRIENSGKFKAHIRKHHLKSKYGITPERYNVMLWLQNGHCALCDVVPNKKQLHVDHCHETGKVRGLLCIRCNSALAQFGDNIDGLKKVLVYLGQI